MREGGGGRSVLSMGSTRRRPQQGCPGARVREAAGQGKRGSSSQGEAGQERQQQQARTGEAAAVADQERQGRRGINICTTNVIIQCCLEAKMGNIGDKNALCQATERGVEIAETHR